MCLSRCDATRWDLEFRLWMLVCIPTHILIETSSAEVGGEIAASHHVDLSDYLMGPFDNSL